MTALDVPRRAFLAMGAAAVAGVALPLSGAARRTFRQGAPVAGNPAAPASPTTLRLGVASYSLRNFPLQAAIEMVRALGMRFVNFKSVHLPFEASADTLAAARAAIRAAGLEIVGGGVINFEEDSDPGVERYFTYARAAGMPLITIHTDPRLLPRIERFARVYDIQVAIHNHGPEDPHFPSPYDALKQIRNLDARIGLCIDIGHTVRTGTDVVRAVADAGPRLLDMHVKDLRDLTAKGSQCIVGEGAIPIPEIFRELEAIGFRGCANLEYEIDASDPLPGMKQSFAYMRGTLAGLATARRPRS